MPIKPSRLLAVTALLASSLLGLATAAQSARAGTWYINPLMENLTRSTDQAPCGGGHSNWTGCMILDGSGVNDGNFIANPYGGTGGRHTLPALCDPIGSYCGDGSGPNPPVLDQPSFDAPIRDEGADGYYLYTTPDGNQYSLVAEDDENGLGLNKIAFPGCGALQDQTNGYFCQATYPSGGPSSSPFNPSFLFGPVGNWSINITAAGEMCSVPGGSSNFTCAAGAVCTATSSGESCNTTASPGAGWGYTDPNEFMYLMFYDASSAGSVTVTDRGDVNNGLGYSCTISQGQTCAYFTSGGSAGGNRSALNGASDALQVSYSGQGTSGPPAQVEVLQEAEVPSDLAYDTKLNEVENVFNDIMQAEDNWGDCCEGGGAVPGPRPPTLRSLGVKVRTRPILAYRDSVPATTVVTLAQARPGVRVAGHCVETHRRIPGSHPACTRWVTLAGTRSLASWEAYWAPRGKARPCRALPGGLRETSNRCHARVTLSGHLRHRDLTGINQLAITAANGRPLSPGRYRLTAIALAHGLVSKPVSFTFRVVAR